MTAVEVEAVRLHDHDSGEVKSWPAEGIDADGWDWRETDLQVALAVVPTLVDAIGKARTNGKRLVVLIQQEPVQ